MLIVYWVWNSYPFRLRSKGFQTWPYGQAAYARPKDRVTFYNPVCSTMPSTCSTSLLLWSYAEQLTCSLPFKTSFSRLNPGSRGQATIISNPSETFSLTLARTLQSALRGGAKQLATALRPTNHQVNNE